MQVFTYLYTLKYDKDLRFLIKFLQGLKKVCTFVLPLG